ncbi:MAG: DUF4124 domain-containing protein [Gammaproteobacteria bacterium]|nr:MAG: DUF4124 domain-containing protein [Gammaproteobacteria bacterium]
MIIKRTPLSIVFAALLLAPVLQTEAEGVYKWVDEKGKVHFGDRPPENLGQQLNIDSSPTHPGVKSNAQSQLEARDRLLDAYAAERAEKEQAAYENKAKEEQLAKTCARARDQLKVLQNSKYVYDVDKDGKRIIYTDAERKQTTDELKRKIKERCK